MQSEHISKKQIVFIIMFFILGNTIVMGYNYEAGVYSWLINIAATILSIPFFAVLIRTLTLYQGKTLFDIFEVCFGTILSKIITLLFTLLALLLAADAMYSSASFVKTAIMPDTPLWFIALFAALFCAQIAKHKNNIIGRFAVTVVPVLFLLLLLSFVFSLPTYNTDNVINAVIPDRRSLFGGIFSLSASPYGEIFFLSVLFTRYDSSEKGYKAYGLGLILGSVTLSLIYLRNLLLLGPKILMGLPFSSYLSVAIIGAGEYIQRVEVLMSASYIVLDFFKIACFILFAVRGMTFLLKNKKTQYFAVPASLIVYIGSMFIYRNMFELYEIYYLRKYILAPFVFILPVLLWIIA